MDSILIAGAIGLAVAVVGFGVALWTKDRRTIAIGISLLAIAILLYVSQWQDNHVGRTMMQIDLEHLTAIAQKLEGLKLLLKLSLER